MIFKGSGNPGPTAFTSQIPVPCCSVKNFKIPNFFGLKTYLDADFFFGYSNSEFIDDNSVHLKDKKMQ